LAFSDGIQSLGEVRDYWRVYGGLGSVLTSPAFLLALGVTSFSSVLWKDCQWYQVSFSILPNLLGFSIGAFAIVLAFPATTLFEVIAEDGRDDSFYMDMAARFVHFVCVQVIALLLALLGKTYHSHALAFFGILFLTYAITVAFMTALNFLYVAKLYNEMKKPK